MKIRECLDVNHIYVGVHLPGKDDVLSFLADKAAASGLAVDAATLLAGFREREDSFTTGIGLGIALPHTTSPQCLKTTLFILRLSRPVDFESIDDEPVDVVLALIIPTTNPSEHLQIWPVPHVSASSRPFPRPCANPRMPGHSGKPSGDLKRMRRSPGTAGRCSHVFDDGCGAERRDRR